MTRPPRLVSALAVVSLLLCAVPASHAAEGGRVVGLLLDPQGRPAQGHALLLLDAEGTEVGRGAAGQNGRYAVEGVPRGTYTVVVEAPDGSRAVAAVPPLTVSGNRHRLHLRLMEQGDEPNTAVPTTTGSWWGGLPTAGKVWVVAGAVALGAFAVAGLDDDDGETPASPFQ